jgi:hypothetical protein
VKLTQNTEEKGETKETKQQKRTPVGAIPPLLLYACTDMLWSDLYLAKGESFVSCFAFL